MLGWHFWDFFAGRNTRSSIDEINHGDHCGKCKSKIYAYKITQETSAGNQVFIKFVQDVKESCEPLDMLVPSISDAERENIYQYWHKINRIGRQRPKTAEECWKTWESDSKRFVKQEDGTAYYEFMSRQLATISCSHCGLKAHYEEAVVVFEGNDDVEQIWRKDFEI